MIVIDSTKWLSFLFLYQSKDNGLQKYPNFFINTGTRFFILYNKSHHQSTFVLKSPPFLSVYPIVEM